MFGAFAAALLAACNLDASGVPPPTGTMSYPTGIALSRESRPSTLFLANSNFDLSFSSGSLQGYDLGVLEAEFERCRAEQQPMLGAAPIVVPNGSQPAPSAGMDAGLDAAMPDPQQDPDAGIADDAGAQPLDAGDPGETSGYDGGPIVLPAPATRGDSIDALAEGALCIEGTDNAYRRAGCCLVLGTPEEQRPLRRALRDNEVEIDSYASGLAVSLDNRRLYVPIASSSRLVYFDLDPTAEGQLALRCGGRESADDRRRCTSGPGSGRDDDEPNAGYPGQPSAIAVGTLGDLGVREGAFGADPNRGPHTPIVMTAHELGGLGLYVENRATREAGIDRASFPVLESVARTGLRSPTSVFIDAANQLAYVTASGATNRVVRFGARVLPTPNCDTAVDRKPCKDDTRGEEGPREVLYASTPIQIDGVALGEDLRDISVDPDDPMRLFVLTRGSPRSVLFVRLDPSTPFAGRITDVVRVGAGASKMTRISLGGRSFLVVSSYDARALFIIDVTARQLVSVVRNLSGPFQMAFDEARRLLYVADFRTSVVRVIDLDGLLDRRKLPPRIIATLGALQFTGSLR